MKKTLFLLIVFVALAGGIYLFRFREPTTSSQVLQASNEVTVEAKKIGSPVTLSIPSIGVESEVENVGLDEKRNMDVPKKSEDVGWYNLGPKPGEAGSAVMAGHLDDPTGAPAVFWDLKKLTTGAKIEVTDENGDRHTFIVTDVENYPWNDFPLQKVFADSTGTKLNLITCGGNWDKENKNYSERTVVYADLQD
jgi:sortase (surface protein transpeptidase)